MPFDVDINSAEFLDFYKRGGYGSKYWGDDFAYGLWLPNVFNGDWQGNSPSVKRAKEDFINQMMSKDRTNFNASFNDLFSSGASSEDLMKFVMDNPDVQYDPNIINQMINLRLSDESWSRNLKNMKEAGINPLVGLGNVGSLADYPMMSLNNRVESANVNARDTSGSALSNIKNILLILLALGRLAA